MFSTHFCELCLEVTAPKVQLGFLIVPGYLLFLKLASVQGEGGRKNIRDYYYLQSAH